jgi:hypothetical protein
MKTDEQITRFLRYLAGEASAAEVTALNTLLSSDAAARALYLQVATHAQAQAHRTPQHARPGIRAILISAAAAIALLFTVWALRPDSAETTHSTAGQSHSAIWQDALDPDFSEPALTSSATPEVNLDAVSMLPLDAPCIIQPTLDGISIFTTQPVQTINSIENLTIIQS